MDLLQLVTQKWLLILLGIQVLNLVVKNALLPGLTGNRACFIWHRNIQAFITILFQFVSQGSD